jgi:hypothetical protein
MFLSKGNRWEGEKGNRRVGREGSVYSQPESRVDVNSRHVTREGFLSK